MGYQPEIKHIGIPHAPKLLRSPVRYIDSDEYKRRNQKRVDDEFFNDLRSHPITQHDPLTKLVRNMLGKKFTDNINKESSQIKNSKVNYRMMLD